MNRHVEILACEGFQAQRNPSARRNKRMRTLIFGQGRRTAHWQMVSRSRPAFDAEHLRSEEHTSELQSLLRISYAVFCLKKKKTTPHKHIPLNKDTLYKNQNQR